MLNIFFFLVFLIGILEIYILSNVESYYTKLQNNVIKKIIGNSKDDDKDTITVETLVQYFNLFTILIVLIGLITPYWYIFGSLLILIGSTNYLHSKYEINDVSINKGGINTSLKKLKVITYIDLIIKSLSFFGLGILYFQELI